MISSNGSSSTGKTVSTNEFKTGVNKDIGGITTSNVDVRLGLAASIVDSVGLAVNRGVIIDSWAGLDTDGVTQILGLGGSKVKVGIIGVTIINTADKTILIVTTSDEVGVTLGEGVTSNDNHTDEEGNEEQAAQNIGAASVFHGSIGQIVINWLAHVLLLVIRGVRDFI